MKLATLYYDNFGLTGNYNKLFIKSNSRVRVSFQMIYFSDNVFSGLLFL